MFDVVIFHNKVSKIKITLQKNLYPIFVVDNQIKFLEIQYTTKSNENTFNNKKVYFKLWYTGTFQTQPKLNFETRIVL